MEQRRRVEWHLPYWYTFRFLLPLLLGAVLFNYRVHLTLFRLFQLHSMGIGHSDF